MSMMDSISGYMPDINMGTVGMFVFWGLIVLVVGGAVGGLVIWLILRKRFNKDVILFQKVNGHLEVCFRDKAREIKIGEGGDLVLQLRKKKKILPMPNIQTGRNTYWYYIREDGEWINIGLEDVDEKMHELNVNFLDKEMRYARVALQKGLKDRYDRKSFWQEHGTLILNIIYVIIVGIMILLLFSKLLEVMGQAGEILDRAEKIEATVMGKANTILSSVDNICSNSNARIIPAGG